MKMLRRAVVAAVVGVVGWLCAPALASAVVWGGAGGVVSLHRVGPLWMNLSSPSAVMRWAGKPSSVNYLGSEGEPSRPARATWAQAYYNGAGPRTYKGTIYTFARSSRGWRLQQFSTTLQRFHTPGGTRVGMTFAQAARRERVRATGGCVTSGFWHSTTPGHQPYFAYVASLTTIRGRFDHSHVNMLMAFGPHPVLC